MYAIRGVMYAIRSCRECAADIGGWNTDDKLKRIGRFLLDALVDGDPVRLAIGATITGHSLSCSRRGRQPVERGEEE